MLADINGNLAEPRGEAMTSQRFCLRWNNHQSNMLSVFDQLLHDESFVDVTLAVEGNFLKAHKMVLSACSPYFQALFVEHPDKHPIVILKDIPYDDMRSLLDFMYRGEVSVDQDRLTAFLRVAESLRIKGLTEVNEEKCDKPNMINQSHRDHPAASHPPPSLHRINQLAHHSHQHQLPQKRFQHMSSHPLLGSALTAPKRKRGRPRKLSGSSDTPLETSVGRDSSAEHQNLSGSELVQGSPEMLEMKMSLDFQNEMRANSAGSSGASVGSNASPVHHSMRKDEPTENGTENDNITIKIEQPEPMPGTSALAKDEEFTRPLSRQESESLKPDSEDSYRIVTPEKSPAGESSGRPSAASTPNTPSIPTCNPSTSSTSLLTTTISALNSPKSPRSTNPQVQTPAQQQPTNNAAGAMSAPTGRQVPKRRMRRRATSQSQDPAEQLTEMSVRGLNLFRYASISEGVYRCTECAKADIQKTFKNKYSFQRHAFLYHEGHQRKVFPCPACGKEFSRPDKMKNHMKTVHDCYMPKECAMPYTFYMPP